MLDRPKANRADLVFDAVRADILAVRLRPGAKIRIADFTATYDVSLGVVREALSRLVAEDLVVAEPQKGFRIAPIDRQDLVDLTETRIRIEQICLEAAIHQGGVDWEGEILAAHHRLVRTPDRTPGDPDRLNDDWARVHMRFHDALVSACTNSWMLRLRRMLYERSERYRQLSVPLAKSDRDVAREHADIVDAVMAKDVSRARLLMRDHLERTTTIILDSNIGFPDAR